MKATDHQVRVRQDLDRAKTGTGAANRIPARVPTLLARPFRAALRQAALWTLLLVVGLALAGASGMSLAVRNRPQFPAQAKRNYSAVAGVMGALSGLLLGGALAFLLHHRNTTRNMRALNHILAEELAELELADSRIRKLSRAVECSPVSVVITDHEARIEYVNPMFCIMTGYTAEEVLGLNPRVLKSGQMPAQHYQQMWQTLLKHGQWQGELLNKRKNGQLYWEMAHLSALRDERGQITNFVAVKQDITERKHVEQELQHARAKAEAAARAKADFLANMSHEIRTPMNGVIGMTALLEQAGLNPQQQEMVGLIRNSGEALLGLINDILDFSKIEAGKLELKAAPFNLSECIREAMLVLASKAAQKRLQMVCQVGSAVPVCLFGDAGRLRQILLNLLGNAVKFTETGDVVLKVELAERSPDPASHEVLLHFQVCDTGPGIPEEQQGKLFQMFSQVDDSKSRAHGGTGLGLAISRRLAELHGGRLWLQSRPNEGSVFHFTMRLGTRPNAAATGISLPQLADKSVFLICPHLAVRNLLQRAAVMNRFELHTAASLGQAREQLATKPGWDLVLWEPADLNGNLAGTVAELEALAPRARVALLEYRENLAASGLLAKMPPELLLPKPLLAFELPDRIATMLSSAPLPTWVRAVLPVNALASRMPLRLLLVDDNWINLRVGEGMLSRMGYQPVLARDGIQALEILAQQTFDIVLLDVQMPRLDGYEVARRVTASLTEACRPLMIAVTASALPGDRERCLAAGMCDFLAKPFKVAELEAILEKWYPVVLRRPRELPAHPAVQPEALATAVPPVDFARLAEISNNDASMMKVMINLFEEQAAHLNEQMEASFASGSMSNLAAIAHKLKGSAGACGINAVLPLVANIEQAAYENRREDVARQLVGLRHELGIAQGVMDNYWRSFKGSSLSA